MRTLVLTTALALAAAACGGSTDPVGVVDDASGSPVGAWELERAEPVIDVPDATRITLTVEQDGDQLRAGGTAACNSYGGTVQTAGDTWRIEQLGWTEMGCEEAFMEAEAAYLEALQAVDTWSRPSDDTLELTGDDVVLVFELLPEVEPADLTGTLWEVDGYVRGTGDAAAVSSGTAGVEPATLRLDEDGTFTLFTGCRDFAGEWTTSGDEVVLPSWGQTEDSRGVGADGELTCGDEAEAQERRVLDVVEGGFTADVDGQRLTLESGEVGLTLRATDR